MHLGILTILLISNSCPSEPYEGPALSQIQAFANNSQTGEIQDLRELENIFLNNSTTNSALLNSHLGFLFDRIRNAKDRAEFLPSETKEDAYKFLLQNLRPKKNLQLTTKEDVNDQFKELGVEFDPKICLFDPIFGAGANFGAMVPNPYYDLQLKLVHDLAMLPRHTSNLNEYIDLTEDDLTHIDRSENAVIIVPDDSGHLDDRGAKNLVRALLRQPAVSWVGLEMLPENLQPFADIFVFGDSNSKEWKQANKILHRYYANTWDVLWSKKSEEFAVFSILKEARIHKIRVVGLDAKTVYNLSTEGTETEGIAWMLLRNYLWARNTPKNGVGVLFGGKAHFSDRIFSLSPLSGIRVQDFLKREGHQKIFFLSQKEPLGARLKNTVK